MKFKDLYELNEKFTHKDFTPRDFGDATPTIVPLPDGIEDVGRIETYAHSKNVVHSFIYDSNGDATYFISGDFNNPAKTVEPLDNEQKQRMARTQHPSDPTAYSDYSGVEPLKPPFQGYDGPYHIPKEFNMKDFNPYGSFKGVRRPEEWDLN